LWTLALLFLAVLVAAGAYGFVATAAYHGKMNLLPSMQASLVATGQRIDAAGNSLHNWFADRGQWGKRLGARIGGAFQGARQQANNLTHGRQQLQNQIDQRTSNLQTQVNNVQAAEKATDDRVSKIEQQVQQLQNGHAQQPPAAQPPSNSVDDRNPQVIRAPGQ